MVEHDVFETVASGSQLNAGYFNGIRAIDTNGISSQTADFTTTSTTWVDVTNPATASLTTTRVCTIMAFAQGVLQNDTNGQATHLRLMIDGTAGPAIRIAVPDAAGAGQTVPVFVVARKASVAAGSVAVKLQMLVTGGTGTLNFDGTSNTEQQAAITAMAIIE